MTFRKRLATFTLALLAATPGLPQELPMDMQTMPGMIGEKSGSMTRIEGGDWVDEDTVRTARETASHSVTLPDWTNPTGFEKDVFTFARVIFNSRPVLSDGFARPRRLGWWVDYPDADLNFSHRLRQITSMAVNPDGRVLKLTSPDLGDYPLLFMVHVEGMQLADDEVRALRNYLLSGGSLFITDFWSTYALAHFKSEMKRVLPDREWVELTTEHPLFRSIFPLKGSMQNLRVPTMQFWNTRVDLMDPTVDLSIRYRGEGSETMHVWALFDDKQRIMALAVHNSDLSDGWERESENEGFFKNFSEPRAYPLAINIIFYLMTH